MYNKKYRFERIEQFRGLNHTYDDMEGRICYPAYLKVGEQGWILYEKEDDWPQWPHRLHTSIIKYVQFCKDDQLVILTENTRLTLKEATDE